MSPSIRRKSGSRTASPGTSVPSAPLEQFVAAGDLSRAAVRAFGAEIDVSPGIVAWPPPARQGDWAFRTERREGSFGTRPNLSSAGRLPHGPESPPLLCGCT